MDAFTAKILKTIRREELVPSGSVITVGFSGGIDSVTLLFVLFSLEGALQCKVQAVHVNHRIRGEEADRDEAFCREFCESRGIPFFSCAVNVPEYASENGLSTEEAARILRYRALDGYSREHGGSHGLIAVAHHADDQAETILLNLLRGTGLKGLGGMSFRRDRIIRPFLEVTREEIASCAAEKGLPFVTDSSNFENDYTRNCIRNRILPELRKLNSRVSQHLLSAGETASSADGFLREKAGEFLGDTVPEETETGEKKIRIPRKKLKEEPQILRRYVIIETLIRLSVPLKDWGEAHFSAIDRALSAPKGTHLDLPGAVCTENTYETMDFLYGTAGKTEKKAPHAASDGTGKDGQDR